MPWGRFVELYVMEKRNENNSGETLGFLGCAGELWNKNQVLSFAKAVREFSKQLDDAIEKHGVENVCVRTNV